MGKVDVFVCTLLRHSELVSRSVLLGFLSFSLSRVGWDSTCGCDVPYYRTLLYTTVLYQLGWVVLFQVQTSRLVSSPSRSRYQIPADRRYPVPCIATE